MTYNVFRSDDTGAPAITTTAGTTITALDALLVNGFNSKTITITRSGTTATATATAHGYRNFQNLTISGANESQYNGSFVITNCTANTFDFTVSGSPATPATGTITSIVSPLGWTKEYSGTNLAAYRMAAAASGARFYMRIDNTNGTFCRIRGYETMSDVNTGTGLFPTVAQMANPGMYSFQTAVTTPWICWGTEKGFFFITYPNTSGTTLTPNSSAYDASTINMGMYFGAVKSYLPGDAYNVVCNAHIATNSGMSIGSHSAWNGVSTAYVIARDYTLTSAKQLSNRHWLRYGSGSGAGDTYSSQWPSLITGKIEFTHDNIVSEVDAMSRYCLRCSHPGIGFLLADAITTTRRYWDTFTDGTDTYLVVPGHNGGANSGAIVVKLNGPHSSWSTI